MPKIFFVLLPALALIVTGCSGVNGLNVGTDPDAAPNGSYSGQTLNSPVTDQNPHPAAGTIPIPRRFPTRASCRPPPEKTDGR